MADGNPRVPGIRVLVVVGDLAAGYQLAAGLRSLGFSVARADTGYGAIEACHAFLPRVVLMQLDLPLLRGAEAAARIRFLASEPRPRIVAMYDALNPQQADEARGEAFDGRVAWPGPLEQLQRAILDSLVMEPRRL
jgi:CheY-like chemotaxis protein